MSVHVPVDGAGAVKRRARRRQPARDRVHLGRSIRHPRRVHVPGDGVERRRTAERAPLLRVQVLHHQSFRGVRIANEPPGGPNDAHAPRPGRQHARRHLILRPAVGRLTPEVVHLDRGAHAACIRRRVHGSRCARAERRRGVIHPQTRPLHDGHVHRGG